MADLLDGLAQHLASVGLVDYDPEGVTGDCFIEIMPASPDTIVVLAAYGDAEPDSLLGYDPASIQVRTRGTSDPRVSRRLSLAIYSELHGLGPVTLPDGTQLILCTAKQTVTPLGQDQSQRCEHVTNYSIETRAVTTHRV